MEFKVCARNTKHTKFSWEVEGDDLARLQPCSKPLALERLELLTSVIQKCSLDYPFRFLATLVALHFTPVPHQLVGDKEIQTSIASRLVSLLDYAITRQI